MKQVGFIVTIFLLKRNTLGSLFKRGEGVGGPLAKHIEISSLRS